MPKRESKTRQRGALRRLLQRITIGGLFVTAVWGLSVAPVFADRVTSPLGYYGPYAGIKYGNQSAIEFNHGLIGHAAVGVNGTETAPTAYMGIEAMTYAESNGALCATTSYIYNAAPATTLYQQTPASTGNCTVGQYFYAQGVSAAYTGNGYAHVWTYKSPVIFD